MPVGVFFDGFSSTAEMLEVCREAERAGASSLWFAQHMGYRDALVWATAAASVTQRATLVPTAISPYLWPPLPVAMAISTLGEFARGRVILNVSVGNILNLAESGVEPVKPIRIMRDYVEALRALWDGKPVTHAGELHKLRGAKMVFDQGRQYPIYIASTGPQMLKLAGEIADGVLLSAGLTLASSTRCLDHAAGGRPGQGARPRGIAKMRLHQLLRLTRRRSREDGDAAQARLPVPQPRPRRQHQILEPRYRPPGDHAAHARHDFDGAVRLLPVEAANVFAVVGTPTQCRAAPGRVSRDRPRRTHHRSVRQREERKLALDVVRDIVRR